MKTFLLLAAWVGCFIVGIHSAAAQKNRTDDTGQRIANWEIRGKDERLNARGAYVSGQRDGEWAFFFSPIGRFAQSPDIKGSFNAGIRSGEWEILESRSRNLLKGSMQDGRMAGKWRYYDKKGRVLAEGYFNENNMREGKWTIYRNGSPMCTGAYQNGERVGEWAFDYYHEDSSIHVIGTLNYSGGARTGNFQHFKVVKHPKFPTSEVLVGHGLFQNGKKTGRWIEYAGGFKGERIETGYYDGGGKRTGNWETTINGRTAQECAYNDGQRQGAFKTYYENGKVKYITSFERDLEHGFFTSYYENGKIREKGAYTVLESASTGAGDTIFYKVELPLEVMPRLIDDISEDADQFNFNCIAWISDMESSLPLSEVERRYKEALQYGRAGALRVQEVRRKDKISVRVGDFKSFYENGQISLEGRYLPFLYERKVSETSTEKDFCRDGEWKAYDDLGNVQKVYHFERGELKKVTDGGGGEISLEDNQLK